MPIRAQAPPSRPLRWPNGDVVACVVAALGAAACAAWLPAGHPIRLAVAWPFLLLVPGYLLVQACTKAPPSHMTRLRHLAVSLGLSPPIIALAALATAILPGGFRPAVVMGVVIATCLGLVAVAVARRHGRQRAGAVASVAA